MLLIKHIFKNEKILRIYLFFVKFPINIIKVGFYSRLTTLFLEQCLNAVLVK